MRDKQPQVASALELSLADEFRQKAVEMLIAYPDTAHREDVYLGSRVRVSLGSKLIAARMMQWVMAPIVDDLFPFGDDTARGLAEIWTRPGLLYC
jgi:hypothetical protein